jgi:hypothetical protein
MILRIIAILFGIAFIFAGVAGFVSAFKPNGLLFYYLEVDAMHNLFHIVSGVIAIMAATSFKYAKLYFQVFGIIYALITILGFWRNGDLFIMHVNTADNFLHLVIAVVAILLGFVFKSKLAT